MHTGTKADLPQTNKIYEILQKTMKQGFYDAVLFLTKRSIRPLQKLDI
jgi:hypothetical protein